MNKVILIGNLTKDPELTQTNSGVSVCKFTIAVQRNFANADGEKTADFVPVVAWRGLGENCGKYLAKGKKVAICGRLQIDTYDADDGTKRYRTNVIADDAQFLSPKDEQPAQTQAQPKKAASQASFDELEPIDDDGDLPF